jgi:hypothetical protein
MHGLTGGDNFNNQCGNPHNYSVNLFQTAMEGLHWISMATCQLGASQLRHRREGPVLSKPFEELPRTEEGNKCHSEVLKGQVGHLAKGQPSE